jgi:hypothetical protein
MAQRQVRGRVLRAYEMPAELCKGLARYFEFYNTRRRHSAPDRRTPDAVCFDQATHKLAAWHPGRFHLRQHPSFRVHFLDLY